MKSLFSCRLEYMKNFGSGKQNLSCLEAQKVVKKFDTDQKNCEDEIVCKQTLEEE